MSIHPVIGIGPGEQPQITAAERLPKPVQAPAQEGTPVPGTPPKQESRSPQNAAHPAEFPQDEVQVQRDSESNGTIVIKYMDHSGHVILQVPTSQVLGLARAIDRDLERQAEARADSGRDEAGKGGGNVHGH